MIDRLAVVKDQRQRCSSAVQLADVAVRWRRFAQQELAERKAIIVKLDEQIAATELQRLRVEQRYYTVAAGLLRLPAGQSQELIDLQTQVRKQVKEVEQ